MYYIIMRTDFCFLIFFEGRRRDGKYFFTHGFLFMLRYKFFFFNHLNKFKIVLLKLKNVSVGSALFFESYSYDFS